MSDEILSQDFYRCVTLYKDFLKQSSVDDWYLLVIADSSPNNSSGGKGVSFVPEDRYYNYNEWYALSKSNKDKVLKLHSSRNGGNGHSNSGGHSKLGVGGNNSQGKWKSKIAIIENKVKHQKR